jgi:hypothetical protein
MYGLVFIFMKVTIKYLNANKKKPEHDSVERFIKLLQRNLPLKESVVVEFLGNRYGDMTTGSRTPDSRLKILVKDRILRDVLRTLAHEWVHEYQIQILNREQGPDIGGKNEDEANALSGQLVKKFEKKHPEKKENNFRSFE